MTILAASPFRYPPTISGRTILSLMPQMTAESSKSSPWKMNTPVKRWPWKPGGV